MIREPSLCVTIYARRPDGQDSSLAGRQRLLAAADDWARAYNLRASGGDWPYPAARDVPLEDLAIDANSYVPLVNLLNVAPPGRSHPGATYQCLLYTHHDALVFQLMAALTGPYRCGLRFGWQHLLGVLKRGLPQDTLTAAADEMFGLSVLYWARAEGGDISHDDCDRARTLAGDGAACTEVDLGFLTRAETPTWPQAGGNQQDRWVLITPDLPTTRQEEVSLRYFGVGAEGPSSFTRVAAAHHKFDWQHRSYAASREHLLRGDRAAVEREAAALFARGDREERDEGRRGTRTREVESALVRGAQLLNGYQRRVAQARSVRNTLNTNRRNVLLRCVELVSADAARDIVSAERPVEAAGRFLADWKAAHGEEIFLRMLGQMSMTCEQVDVDVDYAERSVEQLAAALSAGGAQLQVAGVRRLGEIGEGVGLETAGVLASVAALIAIEVLKATLGDNWLGATAVGCLLVVVGGCFALPGLLERRAWMRRAGRILAWILVAVGAAVLVFSWWPMSWWPPRR